jgi:hypothetical protein
MPPPYAAVQYEAKRQPVSSTGEGALPVTGMMEKNEPGQ